MTWATGEPLPACLPTLLPSHPLPPPLPPHSVGSMFPALGRLLLLKLNPISLLALGQSLSVLIAKLFIDFE